MWRLGRTEDGERAVKESLEPVEPGEHDITTEFNEAAIANGVPAPSVCGGLNGAVTVPIVGTPVRVFGWVELDPPDPRSTRRSSARRWRRSIRSVSTATCLRTRGSRLPSDRHDGTS